MRVKCIHRNGDRIPDELLALGYTASTRIDYDVQYGRDYVVFAMMVWKGVIHYLLINDQTHRPDWHPACLFEIVNGRLPSTWFFAYGWQNPNAPVNGVWGYRELVASEGQHYIDLIEREQEALELFEQRRTEMEEEDRNPLSA